MPLMGMGGHGSPDITQGPWKANRPLPTVRSGRPGMTTLAVVFRGTVPATLRMSFWIDHEHSRSPYGVRWAIFAERIGDSG